MLKLSKWFTWVMIATIGLIFTSPQATAASLYKDVPEGHQYYPAIKYLSDRNVISGYPEDGTFRPNADVTRGQVAKMLALELELDLSSVKNPGFTDVSVDHPNYAYIAALVDAGIITGFPEDNTYRSSAKLSRAQMSKILTLAFEFEEKQWTSSFPLTDINEKQWYNNYVATLYDLKITTGTTPTTFSPRNNVTRGQFSAFIFRSVEAKKAMEEPETPPVVVPPPVVYSVDTITNGQVVPGRTFTTLEAAKSAYTGGNQVVRADGKVLIMTSGLAVTSGTANTTVNLYTEAKRVRSYVPRDAELEYISSDGEWVTVQYAGKRDLVRVQDVVLKPTSLITERSYYIVQNGELFHYNYLHATSRYTTSGAAMGPAPVGLKSGIRYYSWDGNVFLDATGKFVAEGHQYFNKLHLRTQTSYTAEELDKYLLDAFPHYNRTVEGKLWATSPLVGIGQALKEVEAQYDLNALYLMAHAIHESGWGTSRIAQDKYNLFGYGAVDGDPYNRAFTYANFKESIEDAAKRVTANYQTVNGSFFNGSFLGNKGLGMNVRYASDPFWGQKIAGHMYRADKSLGRKDSFKESLYMTTATGGTNFRRDASTNFAALYRLPEAGMTVNVKETVPVPGQLSWYRVVPENRTLLDKPLRDAYVRSDLLKEIPLAR